MGLDSVHSRTQGTLLHQNAFAYRHCRTITKQAELLTDEDAQKLYAVWFEELGPEDAKLAAKLQEDDMHVCDIIAFMASSRGGELLGGPSL